MLASSPQKGRWSLREKIELYSQIWKVSETKCTRLLLIFNRVLREKPRCINSMTFNLCTSFFTSNIRIIGVTSRSSIQIRTHLQKIKMKIRIALKGCKLKSKKLKSKKKQVKIKKNTTTNVPLNKEMKKAVQSLLRLSTLKF